MAKPRWDWRCTEILTRNAATHTNVEMAALIEAETGLCLRPATISEHRATLGLGAPRRNDWTAPLRKWRPWQDGDSRRR
jgi:hypothetical protein